MFGLATELMAAASDDQWPFCESRIATLQGEHFGTRWGVEPVRMRKASDAMGYGTAGGSFERD